MEPQFRATVIVPRAPTVVQATGIQSFWPALEPASSDAILQIVFANEGKVLGQWSFFEYFQDGIASTGGERVHGKNINVYPGDLISNGFISTDENEMWTGAINAHKWYVNWIVRRGAEGLAKGEIDGEGNATVDLSAHADMGDFTQVRTVCIFLYYSSMLQLNFIPESINMPQAILATELSRAAKWEMGPIDWQNVMIQIEGTSRDWCSVDKLILLNVTLGNVQAVDLLPTTKGATCFFKGFTVTDTIATEEGLGL
ncbi:92a661b7-33dc-4ad9-a24c-0145b27eef78 [Sclerotinia trifoliorum]|uniref:92a661b7-33dc-4ad9-a24c-0145b27eef78 n=1 Tax=Sclerotinia trifoliorum TaxID=28548 RepID=A0A8H2W1B3_9HELO|nr:92a661b7-33dc-4ad9-a24c-0145b27eef78 [Sclerotinia trifoliorum]